MSTITTKDGTQIYYKDWGTGQPVVFSHGWPLTADAWESQMFFLASHGYRCIGHDRRVGVDLREARTQRRIEDISRRLAQPRRHEQGPVERRSPRLHQGLTQKGLARLTPRNQELQAYEGRGSIRDRMRWPR